MPCGPRSLEDRLFEKRTILENGCWIWGGVTNNMGYGITSVVGLPRNNRTRLVHRIAAVLWKGIDLASTVKVLHRCDTPLCFNPDHLFLGTQAENLSDCMTKGRARRAQGERCATSKLTAEQVLEIRRIKQTTGASNKSIGKQFGIGKNQTGMIVRGLSWRSV